MHTSNSEEPPFKKASKETALDGRQRREEDGVRPKLLGQTASFWEQVIFLDEKTFYDAAKAISVWRQPGTR